MKIIGVKCRIKAGFVNRGRKGEIITEPFKNLDGMVWVGVMWESDDIEDPDWFKASALEISTEAWASVPVGLSE